MARKDMLISGLTKSANAVGHARLRTKLDFERLTVQSSFATLVMDFSGKVLFANDQYLQLSGYCLPEVLGQRFPLLGMANLEQLERTVQWQTMRDEGRWQGLAMLPVGKRDSKTVWMDLHATRDVHGQLENVVATYINEGALKLWDSNLHNKELELRASEERWRFALEGSGDGVWDWDVKTGHVIYSLRWKEMLGYDSGDIAPRLEEWSSRLSDEDRSAALLNLEDALQGVVPVYMNELRMRCKDGSWKWVLARGLVTSRDQQGNALRMVGTHTDLTTQKQAQEMIWHQANFDALTNLPNRRMLLEHVDQEVKRVGRDGGQLALFFIDLDFFKDVNETMGYGEGDRLIVEAARRISACVRSTDIVSRQGGDEFTVVLRMHDGKAHIEQVAQLLLNALGKPYQLESEQVFLTASIGMTVYPEDGKDMGTLLKNADQALYAAKAAGRNQFSFFTPHMQRDAVNRMQLANDLRSAVAKGQLHTVYQPIIELATGAVHKAEALLRWTHPERGAINPAEFIPIAESSGSILEIGDWVFQQASLQVKHWRQRFHPDFQVSINKSPVQFLRAHPGRRSWLDYLAEMEIPCEAIAIEITEGMILESNAFVMEKLSSYQQSGVSISLDDFGTGYSSLSYLQRYPIDIVKIDKSFVMDLTRGSKNWALCKAIIRMSHELGMKVIAEGVETQEQRDMLIEAGCDYGQGYLFSKPLPLDAFESFLTRQSAIAVERASRIEESANALLARPMQKQFLGARRR